MNYTEATEYISDAYRSGINLGLERMIRLMSYLGDPQEKLKIVHIAGTNGKGSVLFSTMSMLRAAGYKVGTYSSPAVINIRDHYLINGEMISEEEYAVLVLKIKDAIDRMEHDGYLPPTGFEIETAMAFEYFYENKCDIVILECGLGGQDDATNIIKNPYICAFVSISLDHMGILGNTVAEIAAVKAGIIKRNAVVINCNQDQSIITVLEEKCKQEKAVLKTIDTSAIKDIKYDYPKQSFSYGELKDIKLSLAGTYQIMNAAMALAIIDELNKREFEISDSAIRNGLMSVKWPCRFERICDDPLIIIDGAHNEDAALRIKESIETYFEDRYIIAVIGILKDKNYDRICELICGTADEVVCVSTKTPGRELTAEELKNTAEKYNHVVMAAGSYEEAVNVIASRIDRIDKERKPAVVVCGSLSYLSEIKEVIYKWIEKR